MYIHPIYSLGFLALNILVCYLFVKKLGKSGCMTYGYIGLIIFSINLFTIMSWWFMFVSIQNLYVVTTSGKQYEATVISYTEEEHYDSDDDRYYTMYKPTVEFTTEAGAIIERELEFSSSGMTIGDTYKINYNETNDKVITLGFTMVLTIVAPFIFCFIFTFLFVGIIKIILGHNMDGFKALVSKVGFYFFIPFLMIGFNLLLIYAIFYGNEVPWFVTGLLVFFVIMLALGTWGYIKMMITKGEPKMRKVGPGKWAGDWESEEEEDQDRWDRELSDKEEKNDSFLR